VSVSRKSPGWLRLHGSITNGQFDELLENKTSEISLAGEIDAFRIASRELIFTHENKTIFFLLHMMQ
jgi:hypothetical protein